MHAAAGELAPATTRAARKGHRGMMLRFFAVGFTGIAAIVVAIAGAIGGWAWWVALALLVALLLLGVYDLLQHRHAVLRNYPILGHLRYLLESIRPELQQYFVERNVDGRPFDRDVRIMIYERAKGIHGELSFGTERDIEEVGYEYLIHSTVPVPEPDASPRVRIGGPDCIQPYSMSLLNISSMSFGALSGNALRALNTGAALGGFAHDTGEGGLTPYHLSGGGDLVWEIGSGYFGTRTTGGHFDPHQFADKAAHPQVKAISIKLSQGAKPGTGGVLPAAKVSEEIARYRGVPAHRKCVSRPRTPRSTPPEN
jgi:glutamate synthase domain-containing protein 2